MLNLWYLREPTRLPCNHKGHTVRLKRFKMMLTEFFKAGMFRVRNCGKMMWSSQADLKRLITSLQKIEYNLYT